MIFYFLLHSLLQLFDKQIFFLKKCFATYGCCYPCLFIFHIVKIICCYRYILLIRIESLLLNLKLFTCQQSPHLSVLSLEALHGWDLCFLVLCVTGACPAAITNIRDKDAKARIFFLIKLEL